jgi:hypothetical protein
MGPAQDTRPLAKPLGAPDSLDHQGVHAKPRDQLPKAHSLPVILRCNQTTLKHLVLKYWFEFNAV